MSLRKSRELFGRSKVELWAAAGLALVLAFFLISGVIAYANIQGLRANNQRVVHTHSVLVGADDLLSAVQDAETGQRGYLLTGNVRYLEPYDRAMAVVDERLDALTELTRANPRQQATLAQLRRNIAAKTAELRETVALRRTNGLAAAMAVVNTDQGKTEMEAIRERVAAVRAEGLRQRQEWLAEMEIAYRTAIILSLIHI